MPYDSNGNYTLVDTYFVENGDTVLPIQHNPVLEDIQAALSATLLRSGVAPMTGNLNMGSAFKITNLLAGTNSLDAVNKSQMDDVADSVTDYFIGCIPSKASNTSVAFSAGNGFFGGKKVTLPAYTKLLNATFTAGTNGGMLDTGVIQASKTYFLFSIRNTTSGAGDYLASLSLSAPAVPVGWELLSGSRVGIVVTNSSTQIINFEQVGNEVYTDRLLEGSQMAAFDTPNFQPTAAPAGYSVDFLLILVATPGVGSSCVIFAGGTTSVSSGQAYQSTGVSTATAISAGSAQRVRAKPTGGVHLTGTIGGGAATMQVLSAGWVDYQCRRLWA